MSDVPKRQHCGRHEDDERQDHNTDTPFEFRHSQGNNKVLTEAQDLFSAKVLESQKHIREKKVRELAGFLGSKEGEVVNLGGTVYITVTNILSNVIFSMDFLDFEGKGMGKELRKFIGELAELMITPDLSNLYPILGALDFQGIQKKRDKLIGKFITIWEDII